MSLEAAVKQGTYRLSQLVKLPGGRSDAELLGRAEGKLAALKLQMLAPFDLALTELGEMAALPAAAPTDVYRKALIISELGVVVGHERVARASFLLCDWIELAAANPVALQRGIKLHVNAMRALRREATMSAEQVALLSGLEALAQQQRAG